MTPDLIAHLEKTGRWNADGIGRRARSRQCPTCGAWTLNGLDDDRVAGVATCDPQPLTTLGEVAALLNGRATYRLHHYAGRLQLDHRHRWAVAADPAESGPFDVVADHTCGHTPGAGLATTTRLTFHRPPTAAADQAPY